MKNFEVVGRYTHCGIVGSFKGNFRVYDDKRVVGTMNDEGADILYNKGKTKLIFGMMDNKELNFWKISPNRVTMPLVYVMDETEKGYQGKWGRVDVSINYLFNGFQEFKGLKELEEALKQTDLETTLGILGRIEKERIEQYLHRDLINGIKENSIEDGWLNLAEIHSIKVD